MDRVFPIDRCIRDDIICHGCTHIAEWTTNELTNMILKKIVDGQDAQLFDFHQVNYFTTNSIKYICITC